MKAMTKLIPIICLFVIIGGSLFYSCSQEKKKETAIVLPLEAALSQAGENRVELEKVLHRYQSNPSDSLKYRAACFLIENMPSYTYYKGKLLEQYLTFFTLLQEARSKRYIHKQWWILSEGCMDRFFRFFAVLQRRFDSRFCLFM